MKARWNILIAVAVVIAVGVWASVFTVSERELAIKFRFGEILKADYKPGLHLKIPFVNNVRKFSRQILTYNSPTEEFLTSEKKNLEVDFFIKWRITDVGAFYRTTRGDEQSATARLREIIRADVKNEFAIRTVQDVVSAERSELMDRMLEDARAASRSLGIQVVDVRVKRIELPDNVSDSVFSRMRQERARVAAQFRAEGAEQSEEIRADADRQRTVLLAEANREAQRIRGDGDAQAAAIYGKAYGQDPEFYSFYRSLQAYRQSIGGQGDVLVLKPDSEFFHYLMNSAPETPASASR